MSPVIARLTKISIVLNPLTDDNRKEHNPPHAHIKFLDNEYTFPISERKTLSRSDFKRKSGQLDDQMIRFAQYVLDNFHEKMLSMWNNQNFDKIVDLKDKNRI